MTGDPTPLPRDVVELIDRHLASMAHVELLVLLAREDARRCTLAEAAAAVHAAPSTAARAIAELIDAGLLARDGDAEPAVYQYAPRSAAVRATVATLVMMYDQRPVTLVRAIYHRPSSAVRSFADAFRLRPDKE